MQGIENYDPRALAVWQNPQLTPEQLEELYRSQGNYNPNLGSQVDLYSSDWINRLIQPFIDNAVRNSDQRVPIAAANAPAESPPPAVEEADSGPDPEVQGSHLRRGLLGGVFRVGHPGGNILGLLGDAFLTHAGRPDSYAPRLQQRREAEALQGFAENPMAAAQRLMALDTERGIGLYDRVNDQRRNEAAAAAAAAAQRRLQEAAEQRRRDIVRARGLSIIGSVLQNGNTARQSYPRALVQARQYWQQNGFDPAADGIDLPDEFDQDVVSRAVLSGLTPAQQQRSRQQDEYFGIRREDQRIQNNRVDADRNANIDLRRREIAARVANQTEDRRLRRRRPMTPQEIEQMGWPAGTRADVDGYGAHYITYRPRRGLQLRRTRQ